MDIPFQFGPLQVVLLCVAGLAFLTLWQAMKRRTLLDGILSFLLILGAVALLTSTIAIQMYVGLSSDLRVARVRASAVANTAIPTLSVEITLYASDGRQASDDTYLVRGNEWMLQGDIVRVSGALQVIGLHSGYKLTRLEGRFDDPNLERNERHSVIPLNGGDDAFFTLSSVLNQFIAPFIQAAYGNAVFNGPGTYTVYLSQSTLWTKEI